LEALTIIAWVLIASIPGVAVIGGSAALLAFLISKFLSAKIAWAIPILLGFILGLILFNGWQFLKTDAASSAGAGQGFLWAVMFLGPSLLLGCLTGMIASALIIWRYNQNDIRSN